MVHYRSMYVIRTYIVGRTCGGSQLIYRSCSKFTETILSRVSCPRRLFIPSNHLAISPFSSGIVRPKLPRTVFISTLPNGIIPQTAKSIASLLELFLSFLDTIRPSIHPFTTSFLFLIVNQPSQRAQSAVKSLITINSWRWSERRPFFFFKEKMHQPKAQGTRLVHLLDRSIYREMQRAEVRLVWKNKLVFGYVSLSLLSGVSLLHGGRCLHTDSFLLYRVSVSL